MNGFSGTIMIASSPLFFNGSCIPVPEESTAISSSTMTIIIPVVAAVVIIAIVIAVVIRKRRQSNGGAAGRAVIAFQNPLFVAKSPQDDLGGSDGIYKDITLSGSDGVTRSNPVYLDFEDDSTGTDGAVDNAGYLGVGSSRGIQGKGYLDVEASPEYATASFDGSFSDSVAPNQISNGDETYAMPNRGTGSESYDEVHFMNQDAPRVAQNPIYFRSDDILEAE